MRLRERRAMSRLGRPDDLSFPQPEIEPTCFFVSLLLQLGQGFFVQQPL
jgi:hypothetical protein